MSIIIGIHPYEVTWTSYGPSILMLVVSSSSSFFSPFPFIPSLVQPRRNDINILGFATKDYLLPNPPETLLCPTHLYSRYTCVVVDDDYDVICLSLFQLGKEHVSIICIQTKEVTKPMYLFMGRYLLYRNKPMFQWWCIERERDRTRKRWWWWWYFNVCESLERECVWEWV